MNDDALAERYFRDALDIWRELDAALDIPDTKRGPAVVPIRLVELAELHGDLGAARSSAGETGCDSHWPMAHWWETCRMHAQSAVGSGRLLRGCGDRPPPPTPSREGRRD